MKLPEFKPEETTSLLAAIVDSSDDAIVSKTLEGIITSWNRGAEKVFGYSAAEAIGQPITLIIPPERHGEEANVLAHIRRGQKIDHFETVRQTKDGRKINISLTVSPVGDAQGKIIGAFKGRPRYYGKETGRGRARMADGAGTIPALTVKAVDYGSVSQLCAIWSNSTAVLCVPKAKEPGRALASP